MYTIAEQVEDGIKRALETGKEIIIYPYGYYGEMVKEVLNNKYGIRECCICDNNKKSSGIKTIKDFREKEMNNYCWCICCFSNRTYIELIKSLEQKVNEDNIVDIFPIERVSVFRDATYGIFDSRRKNITLAQWFVNKLDLQLSYDAMVNRIFEVVQLDDSQSTICEIGPGTGKFMEKFIQKYKPKKYEFYEINKDLAQYLEETYDNDYCEVKRLDSDGMSLKKTPSESISMVFAGNVWPILEYTKTYSYWLEMIRVCESGGYIVFDTCTEDTYTEDVLSNQNCAVNEWRCYPKSIIEKTFGSRGLQLIDRTEIEYGNHVKTLYVFRKL